LFLDQRKKNKGRKVRGVKRGGEKKSIGCKLNLYIWFFQYPIVTIYSKLIVLDLLSQMAKKMHTARWTF
jgi:hypothetical protein